jgi:hypothetical protein
MAYVVLLLVCVSSIPFEECSADTATMVFRTDPVPLCPVPFGYRRPFDGASYIRALCVIEDAPPPG